MFLIPFRGITTVKRKKIWMSNIHFAMYIRGILDIRMYRSKSTHTEVRMSATLMNRTYRYTHHNHYLWCFWFHFVVKRRFIDKKSECPINSLPTFGGYWIFECTGQNQPIRKFACLQLWWIELIDIHVIIIICDVFCSISWYNDGITKENLNVQCTFYHVHSRDIEYSNVQVKINPYGSSHVMYIGHSDFL